MSIQDFERRKALQQKQAQVLEAAAELFNRLQAFSKHHAHCPVLIFPSDECYCGYQKVIDDINKFLGI